MLEKQPFPPMLERLHMVAAREAARSGQPAFDVFDGIGLLLTEELDDIDYDSTPLNVSSFARTGGDGVHYSLLHIDGRVTDQSPVVMSVPMMGLKGNLIVGENLHDFLCLGCEVGYAWLEELVYDWADALKSLLHPDRVFIDNGGANYRADPTYQEQMRQLALLRDAFRLAPWTELESHLVDLQMRYKDRLECTDPDHIDQTADRARRHFPPSAYDSDAPFLMSIQDVFSLNEHAAISGRIVRGMISQGDTVEIIDDSSTTLTGVVAETFLSLISDISNTASGSDQNEENRNLGLVLLGPGTDQISRGMLVVAPRSMRRYRRFRADIYVYTHDESGYETGLALQPENRFRFYVFESDRYGHVILPDGVPAVLPGQEMNVLIELNNQMGLIENTVFPLWFDPPGLTRKWIGEGRITALMD
jgi:hypothetical protein